jgi:hypothetical protein
VIDVTFAVLTASRHRASPEVVPLQIPKSTALPSFTISACCVALNANLFFSVAGSSDAFRTATMDPVTSFQ